MDENRDYEYEPPPGLERPPLPQVLFDLEKPTFNDFWKIVKRKRNSSSPGINGNSYVVYKSSKKITYLLWELLCFIWEKCEVQNSWIPAWIKLLEKKGGCLSPEDMRPISILNVEGRFSLVEKRLSAYMILNRYIKRWQQNALKEVKEEYQSICLAVLDFANAYGSIRHNFIHFALEW